MRIHRTIGAVALGLALAGCVRVRVQRGATAPAGAEQVQREVVALLAHGAAAWSRGDLDGFMADYADDATFITPGGVVRGVPAIRARYAPRFAPGGVRDSLHFEQVEVDIVGPDAINVVAWYVLTRGDSVTARGPTSLAMRRVGGRWRIVHDHSS